MKRGRFGPGAFMAAVLVAGLAQTGAWALTDEEIFRDFRFNFVNPGARSLGMGGAFIATGNDATAAQANPAALHYVYRSEVFLEYREVRPETEIISPSSNVDPNSGIFLTSDVVNNREDVSVPSFVSFAYPMRIAGRRARFAVSRQAVLDVESTLEDPEENARTSLRIGNVDFPIWVNPDERNVHDCSDDARFTDANSPFTEQYSICNNVEGSLQSELIHYNLSFSYAVTDDFSVGVSGTYAQLDVESDVTNLAQDPLGFLVFTHPRLNTSQGLAPVESGTFVDDSDSAFAWTIGIHWHPDLAFPGRSNVSPIRFGLVYRKGPDLAVQETEFETDSSGNRQEVRTFDNRFRVPDRFGLGVSYDAWKHWTFALDVERIEYSDLLEGFEAGVNLFGNPGLASSSAFTIDPDKFEFDVDDATVVHAGVEFSLQTEGGWVAAARAGFFNAPDNRIRLEDANSGNGQIDEIFEDVFRGGDDFNHYTSGFSIQFPAGFEIQLAGDFSEAGDEFLVSGIYRFGPYR